MSEVVVEEYHGMRFVIVGTIRCRLRGCGRRCTAIMRLEDAPNPYLRRHYREPSKSSGKKENYAVEPLELFRLRSYAMDVAVCPDHGPLDISDDEIRKAFDAGTPTKRANAFGDPRDRL